MKLINLGVDLKDGMCLMMKKIDYSLERNEVFVLKKRKNIIIENEIVGKKFYLDLLEREL